MYPHERLGPYSLVFLLFSPGAASCELSGAEERAAGEELVWFSIPARRAVPYLFGRGRRAPGPD